MACIGRLGLLGVGFAVAMTPILSVLAVAAELQVKFNPHTIQLPVVDRKGLRFTRISTAEGLSHARVTQIVQDDQGLIWFGTGYGLNRYDGYKFKVFVHDPRQPNSIGGYSISALFKDRSDILWMSSSQFLDKFDLKTEKFTHYEVEPDGQAGRVVHISQDRAGMLWLTSGTGLPRFDPQTGQIRHYRSGLSSNDVQWTGEDSSGTFWVGTSKSLDAFDREAGNVLLRLDPERRCFVRYRHDPADPNSVAEEHVRTLAADREGNIWVGFDGQGTNHFSADPSPFETFRRGPGSNNLTRDLLYAIYADRDGALWIGNSDGLYRIHGKSGRLKRSTWGSSVRPLVTSIIEDASGRLWIGTWGYGLFRFDRRARFNIFRHADADSSSWSSNLVRLLFIDHAGTLWVGTSDGLNRFDSRTGKLTLLKASQDYLSIGEDPTRNVLWLGSCYLGLHRLDLATGQIQVFRSNPLNLQGLADDLVPAIHGSGSGVVWLGTANGLDKFDPASDMFTNYEKKDGSAGNSVSCILEDEHGALVLASAWGLHRARVYQLAREFQAQLEGRVDERLRVARELHDTLLQSFHGSLFRFQAARNKLPRRPGEAMQALDGAIASAEEAIVEGRAAIQGLRSESSAHSDLERLLSAMGQELEGSQHPNDRLASFSLTIEGRRKVLSPIVQDEICRISQELLRNAFQHAQARRIEAEIRYQATQLRLSIRDERKGIESKVLQEGNRAGHWGLPRVRERAKHIGARLDFWSEEGAGTEVELTVPSGVAYGSDSGGFGLLRRKAGTDAQ